MLIGGFVGCRLVQNMPAGLTSQPSPVAAASQYGTETKREVMLHFISSPGADYQNPEPKNATTFGRRHGGGRPDSSRKHLTHQPMNSSRAIFIALSSSRLLNIVTFHLSWNGSGWCGLITGWQHE